MAANSLAQATRKSLAMGPSVRNLLSHYQLDSGSITSTGPHQTLLKSDVVAYISQHNLQPKATTCNQSQSLPKATSKVFMPNLDTSGYQPKRGKDGFSKIAKDLLDM